MRVFMASAEGFAECESPLAQAPAQAPVQGQAPGLGQGCALLPTQLPAAGFVWISVARPNLEPALKSLQDALQRWGCGPLVDLHASDLHNEQLPSQFDYTSWYDLMVFRRLAAGPALPLQDEVAAADDVSAARQLLAGVDTQPVGFAIFDRVLITVHPAECTVLEHFARRLTALAAGPEQRGSARLPASPADLMLRMVNHMVDSYLDLRRQLTRHLGGLHKQLLDNKGHFDDWQMVLSSRDTLHLLEDTCEDQRGAIQEWIDALDEWPAEADADKRRERELLRVRSRDVQEHIERVLTHIRRLEQSAEGAVQMHFSALSHRTNDIMRTLTVLTAVFLPLNLITGFFGMNFDGLPLIHSRTGAWIALGMMVTIALALGGFFWRRRYLGTAQRPR